MRLQWCFFAAVLAVLSRAADNDAEINPSVQACSADGGYDELCNQEPHMSLLQTSLTVAASPVKMDGEAVHSAKTRTYRSKRRRHHHSKTSLHHRIKVSLASAASLTTAHGSREEAQNHTIFLLGNAFLVILLVALFSCLRREEPDARTRSFEDQVLKGPDVEHRMNVPMEQDVYGMCMGLIVCDAQLLAKGTTRPSLPLVRIVYSISILFATIGIQLVLLKMTKEFVTPQQVASIRDSYSAFEEHMYPNNTRVLYTGYHRGNIGHFQPELFETFDDTKKGEVCQIPFSQLKFLVLILLIWTVTCVGQIAKCFTLMYNFLLIDNIESMKDAIVYEGNPMKPGRRKIIVGLTRGAKFLMTIFIFIPWFLTVCYMCWLGCRWLAATNSFGDFVCNGMALEFILNFKELVYFTVASERTKRDVNCTRHVPPCKREDATYFTYFNSLAWASLAVSWVYLYIFHFQHVLPEYQWDVHELCTPYLMGQLRPDSDF